MSNYTLHKFRWGNGVDCGAWLPVPSLRLPPIAATKMS